MKKLIHDIKQKHTRIRTENERFIAGFITNQDLACRTRSLINQLETLTDKLAIKMAQAEDLF